MTWVAPLSSASPAPDSVAAWRERSGHLYEQLRRPARAMIRRAFRGAFGDDEIEDIYASAWVGTLRALARRHQQLTDEEIRKYVLTAVANHASKELRRRSRRPTTPLESVHAVADDGVPPDERAAKLEDSRVTRDLLASLPPRRRAVMLLRYGWGLEPQQVCGLVKGLSPRAYRKEITRGVDELTEKLRLLERGQWCADREPVLKAYAAGLADSEQQRQAEQHLSHCRHCGDFVGRLTGHLHDVGASFTVPAAVDGIADGRYSLPDRVGDVVDRVRESTASALGGGSGGGSPEATAQGLSASGAARGAGAAGTGVLAKLAGLGTAGKVAAVCLGGGAAATACVAAGIAPVQLPGLDTRGTRAAVERPLPVTSTASGPSRAQPVDAAEPVAPAPGGDDSSASGVSQDAAPAPAPDPPPIAPSAPPQQQEFGVASAAPNTADTGGGSSSTSSGGSSPVQREFGP